VQFFFEVLIGGLLAGVMYSLVALGFVLIFKASGVFNFAQGAMVLFAALTFVSLENRGLPRWAALVATLLVMLLLALVIERVVLRPLVNQPAISLLMATIGLTFCIEGLAQGVWGSSVQGLELGIPDTPFEVKGVLISEFDLFAAVVAGLLVAALALVFQYTRVGRALRAVADDHQAALSVGIPLQYIWAVVWAAAGAVALVAGLLWGSRLGVQFALSVITLKALPVLILGGFTSIAGAIVGGLIIGATEKLAEVYLGPILGGGIENWFPYVFALLFLLVRPEGLFGEKRIERV
jgi:branched-chain amino acid transport system permease protein